MKKTTLWKLTALVLLIAVCLPLIPKAVPPTEAVAVTTVAPLPYAMEQYGQHHSGIYSTKEAVSLDGNVDGAYTMMDLFDDQAGNFAGIFSSAFKNGSTVEEPATEFVPDAMAIYGTYDDTYVYLLVKTLSRTGPNGYGLTCDFGFNFGATQANAQESRKTIEMNLADGETSFTDENTFVQTVTEKEPTSDSTGTYNLNTTSFEWKVAWADIAPEGQKPEESFQKMYLTLRFRYYDSTRDLYWIYGVPNTIKLPSGTNVGDAFGAGKGTFTPNVVNLLGAKGGFTSEPSIVEVSRTDKNTTKDRSFKTVLSLTDVSKTDVKEAGVIFTADTATLGGTNPVWTADGENIFKTTSGVGESTLNFTVSFDTTAANYEKFFSIRPYVLYKDDTVVYGNPYSNTPSYFDAEDVEYKDHINLLLIGDSFCTYYLDEIVQIAKADDIYLYIARSYKSGASAYENWTFLTNNYKSADDGYPSIKYASPDVPNTRTRSPYTIGEILEFADWDYIATQDGYDAVELDGPITVDPPYEDTMSALTHVSKLFRWLEVKYPKAKLFLMETWAFQLGWGYEKGTPVIENGEVVAGKIKSGSESLSKRMTSVKRQKEMYEIINSVCVRYSEMTGIPLVPCGAAWEYARANPIIGDTLCDKPDNAGDYYHEGDIGGGQYLNAAVYYEVITGNDVRGNTWRPSYDLPEEKVLALQEAAHQAVLQYYGEDHYTK